MRILAAVAALLVLTACIPPEMEAPPEVTASNGGRIRYPSGGAAICGDGKVSSPETCDDSNTTSGDGCSSNCVVEIGWTCTGSPSTCFGSIAPQPPAGALLYYRGADLINSAQTPYAGTAHSSFDSVLKWPSKGSTASADVSQATHPGEMRSPCWGNRPCVDFNGDSGLVLTEDSGAFTTIAQPYSICAVANSNSGGYRCLIDDGDFCLFSNVNWGILYNGFAAELDGGLATVGKYDIVCAVINGASSKIYVNNVATTGTTGVAHNWTTFTIGARVGTTSNPWQQKIAEVGVWAGDVGSIYYNYARAFYGNSPPDSSTTASSIRFAAVGDSIQLGANSNNQGTHLISSWLGQNATVDDYGVSGHTAAQIAADYTANVQTHSPAYTHLWIEGGVNNMQVGTAAATVYASLLSICTDARARGMVVYWETVGPWKNTTLGTWTAGRQTITDSLNTLIRAAPASDCKGAMIVDSATAMLDPSGNGQLNALFDTGFLDHLHPNDAGQLDRATRVLHP